MNALEEIENWRADRFLGLSVRVDCIKFLDVVISSLKSLRMDNIHNSESLRRKPSWGYTPGSRIGEKKSRKRYLFPLFDIFNGE